MAPFSFQSKKFLVEFMLGDIYYITSFYSQSTKSMIKTIHDHGRDNNQSVKIISCKEQA